MRIVLKVVVTALALWVACLLPGVGIGEGSLGRQAITLVVVAIIFGLVNAVLKPIIQTLGCALYILTLGLFTFVVNGLLLLFAAWITGQLGFGFHVDGFWWAVLGSIVVSVVSFLLHLVIPEPDREDEHD